MSTTMACKIGGNVMARETIQMIKSGKLDYQSYFDVIKDIRVVTFAKATKSKSFDYLLGVKSLSVSTGQCQYVIDNDTKEIYVFYHEWDTMDEFLFKRGEILFKENCFILKRMSLEEFRELPIYLLEHIE